VSEFPPPGQRPLSDYPPPTVVPQASLPPQPPSSYEPPAAPVPGPSSRVALIVVSLFTFVALLAVTIIVQVPYAIFAPGPAQNTLGTFQGTKLIQISGHPTYPATGSLDFTTVELYGGPGTRMSLWDAMFAWSRSSRDVVPEDEVFPKGSTSQQVSQTNAEEMSESQEDASVAALRELGIPVAESIIISDVASGMPAASVLRKGDVITAVDGKAVADSNALRAAVQALKPGAAVAVTITRAGTTLTVHTKTSSSSGVTVLGIDLDPTYRLPFSITIGTKDIGGPSAGMMFALGIYDLLTPGDLTGGKHIAGTGEIDPEDGSIQPIGGIAQKMIGARSVGAQWFLAPASNCSDVVGHVPSGLRVVKVSTLHQARTDVQAIAAGQASNLPTCS
jgi:PDZ domain-containing protein